MPRHLAGGAIHEEIDPPERLTLPVGGDDRNAGHLVRDALMSMSCDDTVDEAVRQIASEGEDLLIDRTRRQIERVVERPAGAARVRSRRDDRCPGRPKSRRFARQRGGERGNRQTFGVRSHRRDQGIGGRQANDAGTTSGGLDDCRWSNVGPLDWSPRGLVEDVGGKERKSGFGRSRLERPARVVGLRRACARGV